MPQIAILLCTFNGQQHLAEQLDSFSAQTLRGWSVWASDDGSNDATRDILDRYRTQWGADRLSVRSGPGRGFVANFLTLVCDESIRGDFYAYSDQDDIWEPDKLRRAADWLASIQSGAPALYCARTRLVDADNHDIGLSPLFENPPSFANALAQNIGAGHTMVFNEAARNILCTAGSQVDVAAHDWWTYLAVTACGGSVFFDPHPSVRYRQHPENLIGINSGWGARLRRIGAVAQGQLKRWNDQHIAALQTLDEHLMAGNREVLRLFTLGRQKTLVSRLTQLKRSGVRRQTAGGNLTLFMAALLGQL